MAICEADVILTEAIAENTEHILSLEVKDTQGETTIVESRFQATAPRGPFIGYEFLAAGRRPRQL